MRLPVPGPRDLVGVLVDRAEELLALGPRVLSLLDVAETQLARVVEVVDHVALIAAAASREVAQVEDVIVHVQTTVDRVDVVVDRAQLLVERLVPLLDGLEPPLTRLRPTLEVLAETTDPREVAALVAMVDHLPELTRRLETDVLPVMTALGTVGPDLRDLLATSSELNEIIGKLPGLGRIKRRVEQEQDEDDQGATS